MIEMPAAASPIRTKAEQAGWNVEVETQSGVWKDRDFELVTLRLVRREQRIVAMWENGAFHAAWEKWTPDPDVGGVSPRRIGARALAALVVAE